MVTVAEDGLQSMARMRGRVPFHEIICSAKGQSKTTRSGVTKRQWRSYFKFQT